MARPSGLVERMNAEGCIFFVLLIFLMVKGFEHSPPRRDDDWQIMYLTLVQFLGQMLLPLKFDNQIWRSCKDQGQFMNIVLVPCLAQSVAMFHNTDFSICAKLLTLVAVPNKFVMIPVLGFLLMTSSDSSLTSTQSVIFIFVWMISYHYLLHLFQGIVTGGEFGVLNSLCAITVFEWIEKLFFSNNNVVVVSHVFVSLSGIIGCVITCWGVTYMKSLPWWFRLTSHILGPLLVVEASLRSQLPFDESSHFPLSLNWLVEFLFSLEHGYPRYWAILYWGAIFILSLVPTRILLGSNKVSVVIRRKWFHFLAVALFGPVSFVLPQLMSLSYAIALCVLAVLESLRQDIPILQSFYHTFADPTKDNPDNLLVSHVFLILGCAMPHWIAEYLLVSSNDYSSRILLLQWGILCLGIGDAAGAIIGSLYGSKYWGRNKRTMEGSFAMWLSMMIIGSFLAIPPNENFYCLLVATTLTTLLEAFTLQMDNLILPLAGSLIIILVQS